MVAITLLEGVEQLIKSFARLRQTQPRLARRIRRGHARCSIVRCRCSSADIDHLRKPHPPTTFGPTIHRRRSRARLSRRLGKQMGK